MKTFLKICLTFAALIGLSDLALAQSTQLGPSITTASIGTSATMAVVGTNPSRRAFTVCNEHASQTLTITFGSLTPVSGTTGLVLAGGNVAASCYTSPSNAVGGVGAQINAIASGASTPMAVLEY